MDFDELKNIATEDSLELISNNSILFNRLKRQYLKKVKPIDFNYIELLKEGSKFFTYDLPAEVGELFVRKEDAPNLWLLEFPLILKSERVLNENVKSNKNQ